MKKSFHQFVLSAIVVLITTVSVHAFGGGESMPAEKDSDPAVSEKMKELTIALRPEGSEDIQQIPLFSEEHAETAVAKVNGEPITLEQFRRELASMHSDMDDQDVKGKQNFSEALDRLIAIKLVKQEALNIGFDRTPAFKKQVDNFALKTMIRQLLAEEVRGIEVDESEVDELYKQMALEVKLLTYRIFEKDDAKSLHEEVRSGGDFRELANKLVDENRAEGGENPEFSRMNDLLPSVAKAVFAMEPGDVSEPFKAQKGYMLFKLQDQRVYEDPEVRQTAKERVLQKESREKKLEYLKSLEEKYVEFNEEAEEDLDFEKIMEENPEATGTEIFARLTEDKRPLATISNGEETVTITVAEIAKGLESSMYHGTDKILDPKEMNRQKESAIRNKLVAETGRMEARSQGIDTSETFLKQIENFKERLLFDTFMSKAVIPGITVNGDKARDYYESNIEDFSSPLMLKMKSMAFKSRAGAQDALEKLRAGSDFKWVSANVRDRADADNKDILNLGDKLLSITSLPEDLHHQIEDAGQGDLFLYEGPEGLYYTLVIDSVYPPVPKPYEEVQQDIGRILYAENINDALDDWVAKLKDAYETKNFLVQDQM